MSADPQQSPVPLAEISQGPNAFEEFLDRNQKGLIALAILLALGTAAFVVYRGIEKSRQNTAGAAFNKADDLASLQAVITEHSDTRAARSAMVLLADRQWVDGQQDAAIETLRTFIASNADHPGHPGARASLGAKLLAQGKSGDAAQVFQDLVEDPKARYIAPFALISLGDIAKADGDAEKAEAFYNRVKAEFSESPFLDTATRRISALKAKAPVEIEAPPAPESAAPSAPNTGGGTTMPPPTPIVVPPVDDPPPAPAPPLETVPETIEENSTGTPPSNP